MTRRRFAVVGLGLSLLALAIAGVAAAARPAHLALWLCVHQHERSSWHDPNAPYWGGLQLGSWFISHYGARLPHPAGTPDQWSPNDQMMFAEGAYRLEHYRRSWLVVQWPPSVGACF